MTTIKQKRTKQWVDKLWPESTYPVSYGDALSKLTKDELTYIRTKLRIPGLSSLNKQALIEALVRLVPERIEEETIRYWDRERWTVIQKILNGQGRWAKPLLTVEQYDYFRYRGIAFPSTVDKTRVVLIPEELMAWFRAKGANLYNKGIAVRNTEWVRLSAGLLYYYGTMTVEQLAERVSALTGAAVDVPEFSGVLREASEYYAQIRVDAGDRVSHSRVADPEKVVGEQEFRAELEFYPLTKSQILKAAEPDYIEKNQYYIDLVRFLRAIYEISREEADCLVEECAEAAMNGLSQGEVMRILSDSLELPDEATMKVLTDKLVLLMNSTRQWVLKGYSPDELSALRQRASVAEESAKKADVISMETRRKIGRNDPCPCGSGKKFKKCCSG
ncbi:YecA family protein [Paenibacillus thermoaerophilus]|uniref:YecA family protein n=1 Tax=Paenibacillus thermoaerophilus TaxID=1215385 RepID=A0ABW2V431_9BACL|nr:SEC-C metal-binding domain-containing protein [Paenibacillus thermoaerophilus]TMV16191.1 hypothetical protein FE781_09005 [Paenibacillus thermoaerophilus]